MVVSGVLFAISANRSYGNRTSRSSFNAEQGFIYHPLSRSARQDDTSVQRKRVRRRCTGQGDRTYSGMPSRRPIEPQYYVREMDSLASVATSTTAWSINEDDSMRLPASACASRSVTPSPGTTALLTVSDWLIDNVEQPSPITEQNQLGTDVTLRSVAADQANLKGVNSEPNTVLGVLNRITRDTTNARMFHLNGVKSLGASKVKKPGKKRKRK